MLIPHSAYKVTTGYAASKTWNITVEKRIQQTLERIIDDYLIHNHHEESSTTRPTISTHSGAEVCNNTGKKPLPRPYVRELFAHYCLSQQNPDIDDMVKHCNEIYQEMRLFPALRNHFFYEHGMDSDPKIHFGKIKKLFPNSNIREPLPEPPPLHLQSSLSRSFSKIKLFWNTTDDIDSPNNRG